MFRRRKRASTRWNQGAASVEVKGGRFRTGAAAAMASEAAVSFSGILAAGQGQGKAKAVFSYTPGSSFVRERG